MNPLMNMMKGAAGMIGSMNPMGQLSGMTGMFGQIRQFASLVGSRNPQQIVQNYMRMNNIPESQLDEVMNQARDIARRMGIK